MDIRFIKICEKGDRKIVDNLSMRKFHCNPIHLTGGIWVATSPLCIEGIPIMLERETALEILQVMGATFPSVELLPIIRKNLVVTKKNIFDNNDDMEDCNFLKMIFVIDGNDAVSIYEGSLMEEGKLLNRIQRAYVYPVFWQKPSDVFMKDSFGIEE